MNILMVNQPLNNRGDESAHRALVRAILHKEHDVLIKVVFLRYNEKQIEEFKVNDSRVEYIRLETFWDSTEWCDSYHALIAGDTKALKGIKRLAPSMNTLRKLMKETDIVLNAPGGICMGGFQDWGHIDELRIAKNFGKPIAYYGRSFGPFPMETDNNRLFREHSIDLLHYFSFLSIRDKKTEQLADELGIQYVSTVDCAFLENPRVEIPVSIAEMIKDRPYSVFVPNLLIWHYAYTGRITKEEIVRFYCDIAKMSLEAHPEWNILMLPQTMLFDDKEGNDINLFNEIAETLKDGRIIVLPDTYSSDLQQTLISNAQYLIGARYHSVVFAINNNIPFIALSYEHKIEGLLCTLGKKDCMTDISTRVLTQEGRKSIMNDIKLMLPMIKKDDSAQQYAKEIAVNGFEEFASKMLDRVYYKSSYNPSISVIVPVYNVELYVRECLESVLSQDIDDIEVIVVDDCGSDNSMNIVSEIFERYKGKKCCKTIRHQENKGLSGARNTGISVAKGDWLYFIDSDDRMLPGALKALLDTAETYPVAEIIQGSAIIQNAQEHEWLNQVLDIHDKQYPLYTEDHTWIAKNMLTILPMTAWNKLVNREFIIENKLTFKEGLIHEDELWRWRISKVVQRYATCPHQCYWYRTDNNTSIKSEHDLTKSYAAYISIIGEIFCDIATCYEFEFVFDFFGGLEYKESQWPFIQDKRRISNAMRDLRSKAIHSSAPKNVKKLLLMLSLPYWLSHRSRIRDYFSRLRCKTKNTYQ